MARGVEPIAVTDLISLFLVDDIQQRLASGKSANIFFQHFDDAGQRNVGRACDVRSDDDVFEFSTTDDWREAVQDL